MPSVNKTPYVGLNQWQGNEYPKREDFNEDNLNTEAKIKQNADNLTSHLAETVAHGSTGVIIYYVNAATGLDSNNGLTSGTAFKTIQKAIDSLPRFLNHQATINVAAGTYNETVFIEGFYGKGNIEILGGTSLALSDNYIVNSIRFNQCTVFVKARGFKGSATTKHVFEAYNTIYGNYEYCKTDSVTATYSGVFLVSSKVKIFGSLLSNKANAIQATNGSIAISDANSGTGNTNGLNANFGATVAKNGTQPSGTTSEITAGGGVIR